MDIGKLVLELHAKGLSPLEMTSHINMSVLDLTRMVRTLTDSRLQARSHLNGAAIDMARNIVENGKPSDHIAALKGLKVLDEDARTGLTIIIGAGSAVQVNIGTPHDG